MPDRAPRTVIVCGGRHFTDWQGLAAALAAEHAADPIGRLIHGGASGVDTLAGNWASDRGVEVQCFPARWSTEGRAAGPRRNARMLAEGRPNEVLAFPGGRGTEDMVRRATAVGVPVRHMLMRDRDVARILAAADAALQGDADA